MGYTAKETRILIDFHRQYGTNHHSMKNYYLEALANLEEALPDMYGEIEELCGHYDDPEHFAGAEHKEAAAELVLDKLAQWAEELEEARAAFAENKTTAVKFTTAELFAIMAALADRLELVTSLAEQSATAGAEYTGHYPGAGRYQKEAAEIRPLLAKIQAGLKPATK